MDWRAQREAAGLTRREAACLTGVNLRTLQLLEQGKRKATPGLAAWLARAYAWRRAGERPATLSPPPRPAH
jgi:transcriptional regulator with XRE-family HTH domain